MKKSLLVAVLLTIAIPFSNPASAAECLCRVMAMFPVDGGNWLHYATVNATGPAGCTIQYPTGTVGPPQYGQSCFSSPGTCGTCSTLSRPHNVAPVELYYGDAAASPVAYDALDADAKVKDFLKTHIPNGADPAPYDDLTFSRPFPSAYQRPIVVLLTRKVGEKSEDFHAIVWQIKHTSPHASAYVGVEISSALPPGARIVKPTSVCNAVATSKDEKSGALAHEPVPGLLQVTFAKGNSPRDDSIAYIRLFNSDANKNAAYPPCKM